jgi:hypothetical protein
MASHATHSASRKLPILSRHFLVRVALFVAIVTLTEKMPWYWLRFFTSEAILRCSLWLGVAVERVSFDTIRMQQGLFQFVVPCTFVDVVAGSIPLLWDIKKRLFTNLLRLTPVSLALFGFNLIRLQIGYFLFWHGVPWVVADSVLGGICYFLVWLMIWRGGNYSMSTE